VMYDIFTKKSSTETFTKAYSTIKQSFNSVKLFLFNKIFTSIKISQTDG